MTFPGTFARERPDHPAIVMAGRGDTLTYRELDERSNQLAQLWYERGLRRGDHVAILLRNHPRYLEVVAALRSGLYYTPVNWHLTAPRSPTSSGLRARRWSRRSTWPTASPRSTPRSLVIDGDLAGWERYEDVVGKQPTTRWPGARGPGDVLLVRAPPAGRRGSCSRCPIAPCTTCPLVQYASPIANRGDDVYLSPAPLYHTAPVVFSPMAPPGGTTVILEKWDPTAASRPSSATASPPRSSCPPCSCGS